MKTIVLIVICLCFTFCKNDMKESQVNVSTEHTIILKNQAGENLLDPSVPSHYVHDQIYVFIPGANNAEVVIANNKVEYLSEISYYLRMIDFDIKDPNVNQQTVYLRLSPTIVDTIKVEYKIDSGNLYTTKLWYNGELKWTKENDKPIEIIK